MQVGGYRLVLGRLTIWLEVTLGHLLTVWPELEVSLLSILFSYILVLFLLFMNNIAKIVTFVEVQ